MPIVPENAISYALKNGLLGKYLAIIPQKSNLNIPTRNLCLSKMEELFRKLPVQKTGRTRPA